MVETDFEPFGPERLHHWLEQVLAPRCVRGLVIGQCRVPQAKAIVVFGGDDKVLHPRVFGLACPGGWLVEVRVEMVEIPEHPWFVACQFHPEFTSTPRDGHPLFSGFITAARAFNESRALMKKAAKDAHKEKQ